LILLGGWSVWCRWGCYVAGSPSGRRFSKPGRTILAPRKNDTPGSCKRAKIASADLPFREQFAIRGLLIRPRRPSALGSGFTRAPADRGHGCANDAIRFGAKSFESLGVGPSSPRSSSITRPPPPPTRTRALREIPQISTVSRRKPRHAPTAVTAMAARAVRALRGRGGAVILATLHADPSKALGFRRCGSRRFGHAPSARCCSSFGGPGYRPPFGA